MSREPVELPAATTPADPSAAGPARRRFRWARDAGRSRRGQRAVLTAVVALLVAFSGLLVLLTLSIARTMVDQNVEGLGALGRTVEVSARSEGQAIPAARLAPAMGAHWDGLAGPVVTQQRVTLKPLVGGDHEVQLTTRGGACGHLRFASGRCPEGRTEIALSTTSSTVLGLGVGDRIRVTDEGTYSSPATFRTMRIAGTFEQRDDDPYWRGLDIEAVPRITDGLRTYRRHTWIASEKAFGGTSAPEGADDATAAAPSTDSPLGRSWAQVETSVSRQLTPGLLGYDNLPDAVRAVERTRALAAKASVDAQVVEQVGTVDSRVRADLDQIRVIAPLLLAQLVLLQAVLVWIVLRALLTERRREVALLRLRAPGRRGARRLLLGELAPPVVLGLPAGLALAYALDWIIRSTWLGGTGARWSWLAVGVTALATVVCLASLAVLVRSAVRTPVSELLRGVPPRQRRWTLSSLQAVVLALALAMLVTVATGTLTGEPVLVTPLVIALAAGLIVGGLLVPVGNRVAGRLLRRGRLAALLALTDLSRRPSTRNLILAMTAAGALLAFTTSTLALGIQNRQDAAAVEAGAVVRVEAVDVNGIATPDKAVRAIDRLDPSHRHITPVVRVRSGGSDGPALLAGYPDAMSRLALRAGGQDPWAALASASESGTPPAVVAGWSPPSEERTFSAPTLTSADGPYTRAASVDLIAGGGAHTFASSLKPLLAQADRVDTYTLEIWSDNSDPGLVKRAEQALAGLGYDDFTHYSVADRRAALDRSATAYGLQLGLIVAGGAVVVAALVLTAVLSSQRLGRRRDREALARAGVSPATLGRAGRLETLLILLPLPLGGVVGWLGARLAAPHVPWFTEPPPYPIASDVPPMLPALVGLAVGLVVVGGTAVLVRRSGRTR